MSPSTHFIDDAVDTALSEHGSEHNSEHWGDYRDTHGNKRRSQRVAAGIALSIAAHLALLFALRYHAPMPRDDGPDAPERLVVYLKAPPPPPPPAAAPTPAPAREPAAAAQQARPLPRRAPKPRARETPATEVIALPESPSAAPARESQFTVAPPAEEKTFDPDAARKFARSIATKPDPARAGMAVAQIPEKPLEAETKAARLIGAAKRGNCKDVPANLLTPLLMLLDKKDHGCKW